MLKLKKKNLWIYLILILSIYFSYLYYKTSVDYNVLVKQEQELNEKIDYEKSKKESLRKVDKSVSSKETIESMARSDLNYLKENETLFIDGEKSN